MNRSLLLALGASALLGCSVKTVDRPVTVTTHLLPEASKPEVLKNAKEVLGESCSRVVLLIIPVGFATAESAYAEALGQAPGADTILSYEARMTNLFVFPFYYQVCTQVHGYAVSSKTMVSRADDKAATEAELRAWKRKFAEDPRWSNR